MSFSFTKRRSCSAIEVLEVSIYVNEDAIVLFANVLSVEVDRDDRVPVPSKLGETFEILELMILNLVVRESRKMCGLALE